MTSTLDQECAARLRANHVTKRPFTCFWLAKDALPHPGLCNGLHQGLQDLGLRPLPLGQLSRLHTGS